MQRPLVCVRASTGAPAASRQGEAMSEGSRGVRRVCVRHQGVSRSPVMSTGAHPLGYAGGLEIAARI